MKKKIYKSFVPQHDKSDCGIACLLAIIRFYGGHSNFDELRRLSGTTKEGTTMLGLKEAAQEKGFTAEGFEASDIKDLFELDYPAILHFEIENHFQHYVVFWPNQNIEKDILITDPGKGTIKISYQELNKYWKTKALLLLIKNNNFTHLENENKNKRKWLFNLIKNDIPILSISLFLGILISIISLTTTIFTQSLIDSILPQEDRSKLIISLVFFILLIIGRYSLGFIRGTLVLKQGVDFNNRIISWFYSKVIGLPKSFIDSRTTGDLLYRINDSKRIQSILSVVFGNIVIDLLLILVAIIFISFYSTYILGVIFLSFILNIFFIFIFRDKIVEAQKRYLISSTIVESNFVDTFQGISEIKQFNKKVFFENYNSLLISISQNRYLDLGRLNLKFGILSELCSALLNTVVIIVLSQMFLLKELTLGEIISILGMSSLVLPASTRLTITFMQFQEAFIAFDRMYEFASIKGELKGSNLNNDVLNIKSISFDNVSYKFPGRLYVLSNIVFRINRGELVCLYGESGSGKSTLLQILQKLYTPQKGKIIVNDKLDYLTITSDYWRSVIGSVSQTPKVFNGSLAFNICLDFDKQKILDAINFCNENGFSKYFDKIPNSYNCIIGESGISLSGGQIQLLAIARALFLSPQILLLDEPTSAMDSNMENFVFELLNSKKQNMITLLVSHNNQVIERCDRVVPIKV
ncbi:MAG: cysteine peptidase family C39 domain-containing protein [Cyclobacteriaceae bacterium]|nr:cysteine peptidase family C39 domain-containing protein [Cyclobacteriaceae bacterium]